MIRLAVFCDAEGRTLRNERNVRNKLPEDLDLHKKFIQIFENVWEVSSKSRLIDKLRKGISWGKFPINEQTPIGLNTPLHFAVMHENIKAISLLMSQEGILKNVRNS